MLRVYFNAFTAYEKYSPLYRDNFTQEIHMILSLKQNHFSGFRAAFLTSRLNFQDFHKKVDPRS